MADTVSAAAASAPLAAPAKEEEPVRIIRMGFLPLSSRLRRPEHWPLRRGSDGTVVASGSFLSADLDGRGGRRHHQLVGTESIWTYSN